jgi:enamine deaminase RidA (YjgF/YER057c/UK114 family)
MTAVRRHHSTGTPWEAANSYSRAVRVGPFIHVSGTVAADATGTIQHQGDAHGQALYALAKIEAALKALDSGRAHVVRTRLYLVRDEDQGPVGKAHGEFFKGVSPACAMVVVSSLAGGALVEIEVEAIDDGAL